MAYVRDRLEAADAAACSAAGVLLYSSGFTVPARAHGVHPVMALLGFHRDGTSQTLGGKRDGVRAPGQPPVFSETVAECAAREFDEESGRQLRPRALVGHLKDALARDPLPRGVSVAWVPGGKFALFLVDADDSPDIVSLDRASATLAGDFNEWRAAREGGGADLEMRRLSWVPLGALFDGACGLPPRMRPANAFLRDHIAASPVLQEWAAAAAGAPRAPSAWQRRFIAETFETRRRLLVNKIDAEQTKLKLRMGAIGEQLAGASVTVPEPEPTVSAAPEFTALDAESEAFKLIRGFVQGRGAKGELKQIKEVEVPARTKAYNACLQRVLGDFPPGTDRNAVERCYKFGGVGTLHGTGSSEGALAIARYGFDPARMGSIGLNFGRGFYFSDHKVVADTFAMHGSSRLAGSILVCDIVLGKSLPHSPGPGSEIPAPYHSVQCNYYSNPDQTVFVVKDPDQVRVRYIVDYNDQDQLRPHEARVVTRKSREARQRERLKEALEFKKCNLEAEQRAGAFFGDVCKSVQGQLARFGDPWVDSGERLFAREHAQFSDSNLRRLYAHKRETLELLRARRNAVLVLQGGTGIGKTVCMPQWVLDDVLMLENRAAARAPPRIAVLVPRVKIAEDKAKYVAQLRGVTLGNEVGFATGRAVKYHPTQSRIIFFTPGFFFAAECHERAPPGGRGAPRGFSQLSKWDAVIVDEVRSSPPPPAHVPFRGICFSSR